MEGQEDCQKLNAMNTVNAISLRNSLNHLVEQSWSNFFKMWQLKLTWYSERILHSIFYGICENLHYWILPSSSQRKPSV